MIAGSYDHLSTGSTRDHETRRRQATRHWAAGGDEDHLIGRLITEGFIITV
jgi:hypothetical protein